MRTRLTALVPVTLLALASSAFAQLTGSVTGRVLDQTGAALPGVSIDLAAGGTTLTTVTDGSGAYRLDAPAGPAEISFRLINFTVQRRAVVIGAGQTAPVSPVLHLSLSADVW